MFLYLSDKLIEMTKSKKFSSSDGLVERAMFCLKKLYPIMIKENRAKNHLTEIEFLSETDRQLRRYVDQFSSSIALSYLASDKVVLNEIREMISEREKVVVSKFKI